MEWCPAHACLSLEAGLASFLPGACLLSRHLANLGEVHRGPGLVTHLVRDGGPGERKVAGITLAFDSSTGLLRMGRSPKLDHICRKGGQAAPQALAE